MTNYHEVNAVASSKVPRDAMVRPAAHVSSIHYFATTPTMSGIHENHWFLLLYLITITLEIPARMVAGCVRSCIHGD